MFMYKMLSPYAYLHCQVLFVFQQVRVLVGNRDTTLSAGRRRFFDFRFSPQQRHRPYHIGECSLIKFSTLDNSIVTLKSFGLIHAGN